MPLDASPCRSNLRVPTTSGRLVRAILALGVVLGALAWSGRADAFHWMIRHDYTACNTRHADPSGAGILTAYGRGLEETVVRTRYGKKSDDEDPGTIGNFMFGAFKTPEELLLQFDLRGMHLIGPVPVAAGQPIPYHYYFMQADLASQLKVGRFRVNGSLGWAHEGGAGAALTSGWTPKTPTDFCSAPPCDRLISRQYWIGVDIGSDEQFLLRAGRINLPFGVRQIEHTMWVRKETRTNINDNQQHGVALSWNQTGIRAEIMAILGNFAIHGDPGWDMPHERGYSGYFEWAPKETFTIGATSLATFAQQDLALNTALWRQAHGLFARWSPAKPVVLTAESDFLFYSQPATATVGAQNRGGNASMLMVDVEPTQGVHVMLSSEIRSRYWGAQGGDPSCAGLKAGSFCGTDFGLWGGAWWFFAPHLDVRADVNWAFAGGRDSTSLLFQLHGYL